MNEATIKTLIREAFGAVKNSYAPYSNFNVGAALLTKDGQVYGGCNIENAAYTPTNCAERTAFFKAVSEGKREFEAICIIGGKNAARKQQTIALNQKNPLIDDQNSKEGGAITDYCAPCGVCRQVMMEFCDPDDFKIILAISEDEYQIYTLRDLFPQGFGPANLT